MRENLLPDVPDPALAGPGPVGIRRPDPGTAWTRRATRRCPSQYRDNQPFRQGDKQMHRWIKNGAACALVAAGLLPALAGAQAQPARAKVFLSMSYVGNDWQAEASNMVKAMAAHPRWPTRSTCRCRWPVPMRRSRSSRSTPWCRLAPRPSSSFPSRPPR
ncbi:hypothetical protein WJ970_28740 [Achromobacter xylosoxidans]